METASWGLYIDYCRDFIPHPLRTTSTFGSVTEAPRERNTVCKLFKHIREPLRLNDRPGQNPAEALKSKPATLKNYP